MVARTLVHKGGKGKDATVKLYKFRSLGDECSFCRAKDILTSGQFWCSTLWDQNDPMEGVYCFIDNAMSKTERLSVFSTKNHYRICSFSDRVALRRPLMWGHYANGFRGIAIEVKVAAESVTKVVYKKSTAEWPIQSDYREREERVKGLLTTKLTPWRTEREYRFLTKEGDPKQAIGQITAVYFGDPYGSLQNKSQILTHSPAQRSYHEFKTSLSSVAKEKGYTCFLARIDNTRVKWDKM